MATPGRRYGGASPQERSAQRRTRLVEAGLEVFGTTGFRGATVRSVCREAGLTDRYYYEHFRRGEELLLAVYAECLQRLTAAVVAAVPPQADVGEQARLGLDAFLRVVEEDARVARVVWFEVLGVSPEVEDTSLRAMDDFADLLLGFAPGVGSGLASPEQRRVLARAVVGGVSHVVMTWVHDGLRPDRGDVTHVLTQLLVAAARVP